MSSSAFLALSAVALAVAASPASAQDWRTLATARQSQGEEFLDVRIKYAAGRFEITKGTDRYLYRLASRYDAEAFDLRSDYRESESGGRLRVELEGEKHLHFKDLKRYDIEAGSLRLAISGTTRLALDLELGAVEAVLELGGLKLQQIRLKIGASDMQIRFSEPNPEEAEECSFKVGAAAFAVEGLGNSGCRNITFKGGVGSTLLDFSGEWQHDAEVNIEVGLGSLEIRVPSELGVRIERNTFLMGFDAQGIWIHEGNTWTSENWGQGSHDLTIHVRGALGTIEVAQI